MKKQQRWTPFKRANATAESRSRIKRELGLTDEDLDIGDLFINSRYQVVIRRQRPASGTGPDLVHLSVKRRDMRPAHDWRDLQRIKNELLGPEHEAIELYPAESRRVDAANQYHLWALDDPTFRWPVGFGQRMVSGDKPLGGGKQRPLDS